jgi:hypothetical protein
LRGRGLRSSLAEELKAATQVPILIAPPSSHRRGSVGAVGVARS